MVFRKHDYAVLQEEFILTTNKKILVWQEM